MTTVSLANIQHLIKTHTKKRKRKFFSLVMKTLRILLSATFMYTNYTAVLTEVIMFTFYPWDFFIL